MKSVSTLTAAKDLSKDLPKKKKKKCALDRLNYAHTTVEQKHLKYGVTKKLILKHSQFSEFSF